ncbi:MAG: hypothetical protein PHI85_00465 [Victivallaceae bacterium]|nr:hypothetical protein [Victivallaceae bacterium]
MAEKKKRRWLGILIKTAVGVILVVLVLIVAALFFIDGIAASGIRTVTPVFTGTPVQLKNVKFGLFSGEMDINGLVIGNPPDYIAPSAVAFNKLYVDVDVSSIASDRIVIDEIRIVAPEITWKQGLTGSNLGDIQRNVEKMTAAEDSADDGATAAPATADEAEAQKTASKKVVIRHLVIEGAMINVGLKGVPAVTVPLPTMELNDIGEGEDWTVAQAVDYIYTEILLGIVEAVRRAGIDVGAIAGQILSDAGEQLSELAGQTGGMVGEAAAGAGGAVGDALGTAAEDVGKGVGNIVKGLGL